MTTIRLYDQPFAPATVQVFEAVSIGEWLLKRYGAAPSVTVQVFAGQPSADTEVTHDLVALVHGDAPEYVVLESPGIEYFTFEALKIALLVFAVASSLLAQKPSLPGNVNRTQASPNNSLGNRDNQVRYLQRVEDIYGTVRAVPSLMMPTYNKYINHKQFEYGYYCVGRGYYDVADVRDGDTQIANITGAKASFYNPFTSPNSGDAPYLQIGGPIDDDVLTASRAIEVDGVTLAAPNQVQLPASDTYTYQPDPAGDRILQVGTSNANLASILEAGDTVTITMAPYVDSKTSTTATVVASTRTYSVTPASALSSVVVGDTVTISGFATASNNGVFTVATKPTADAITVTSGTQVDEVDASGAAFSVTRNYSGSRVVDTPGDREIVLTGAVWPSPILEYVSTLASAAGNGYTDWVTLPDADRTQVWVNIIAVQGMFKDDGGRIATSVEFQAEIERLTTSLTPTGEVEIVVGTISGSVSDQRAVTVEHTTAWVGPARVRMIRNTDFDFAFKGTVIDEIKWADLYSISPVTKTEFGNKTTVHTITVATARATAVRTRQLNCIASRLLPTFNGTTFSGAFDADGRLASGTLAATSALSDIIAAVSVDPRIGHRNLATDVDMAQIYGVQQALDAWNAECGQFNYTLDSDNISYEETINLIANAGFCVAYRQNGKIRLGLDQAQPNSTALFTHRNKARNAETVTRKFASDSEYDGVEFVYVDPDTEQSETIILPLDETPLNARKYEIAGIRSFDQAWLRANREYYKIRGQRVTIETSTTNDARALIPNARVDIVDNTRFKSYDGEVVAQAGMVLTLSRAVAFTSGQPHSLVLMKRDGTLQSVSVTAGAEPRQVIMASLPAEAIVTQETPEGGIRTIFSFASDDARAAQAYLVQEIDLSDNAYPVVRAVNYSASYYQADYATIPDKETIIN